MNVETNYITIKETNLLITQPTEHPYPLLLEGIPRCFYFIICLEKERWTMKYLFLWYPKCTTCQKVKKWLDEHKIQYELRDIKQQNPTVEELTAWHKQSGHVLKRFFNTNGLIYKDLGLAAKLPDMDEAEQLALLATDGMLVKRPLLIGDDLVLVGFKEAEWNVLQP